jgi:L-ascorbate metabolism protein UlaG (beta-lactamase superfamily)
MVKKAILIAAFAVAAAAQVKRPTETVSGVKITPIRHASVMIEAGGKVIHVDPWSQGNYEGVPGADLILITDIHGDHMDPKAIEKVKKAGTQIVAPAEVAKTVREASVIRNGEKKTFAGFSIEAIPMYNLKRGPSEGKVFHEKGRGNGYVITAGNTRIYIAGDTEGIPEMRALKNIDIAFVPMNLPYTMTPEEAAEAVKAFKPKVVYPYHYRDSDPKEFAKALNGTGIDVQVLDWYY